MPIDFRTYQDPGVYIEAITPPVVFTAAIEPTILAIIGDAPSARDAFESTNLLQDSWVDLSTLGGDPSSLDIDDRLLGTQYVSAAFGVLVGNITAVATTFSITLFEADWIEPAANFTLQIEDEQMTVDVGSSSIAGSTYSVTLVGGTRGLGATDAAVHSLGQVANNAEEYSTTASIEVAVLAAPVGATSTEITATELYGVQIVDLSGVDTVGYGAGDSFKLTYDGQETTAFVNATNATATDLQNGLIALSNIDPAGVTVTGTTNTGPFTVKFFDPNTDITALTITTKSGFTGGNVSNRGVAADTYLDVEGERMLVVSATGSAPQSLVVERGSSGTSAGPHGAVNVYENTGADYLVKAGVGDDGDLLTADDTTSILILDVARIADGSAVNVSLEATDAAQFSPALFNDIDTIREKYGDPLDTNGQVNSELTLGAQLAFANGATQTILVATDSADANPVQDAIAKLEFEQSVNGIAVLSGNANDINYAKGHVEQMADQGLLRRVFVGLDGLSDAVTSSTFITKAQQLNSERVSLVAPGQFKLDNGSSTPLLVPGYFAAAAVAGLQAGLGPAEPLTRKQVFGFVGINDQDSSINIFTMQSKGVLVVFEDRFGRLIIKHGLTTDMTSVYTREISVVTSRDRLRDFILETLDGGALIGSPMNSETPNLVMAAVNSALEESVRQGLIFDYDDVKFRFPLENVTMIQIRFSYKPTLPLNYIHVQFSIDTTQGTVEFQSINENTST